MPNALARNPLNHFDGRYDKAHHSGLKEMEEMQLDAAQDRFAQMVQRLPPLQTLAEQRGITQIESLEQLSTLSFHHSIYKSYPPKFLFRCNFPELSRWLNDFTTNDLTPIAKSNFPTIDAWLETMNTKTNMHVLHSSGTTGLFSFMARGKQEQAFSVAHAKFVMGEMAKPHAFHPDNPDYCVIWPSYTGGYSGVLTLGTMFRDAYCASQDDYYPLIQNRLSADYQLYLMQMQEAQQAGTQYVDLPNEYVKAAIDQADILKNNNEERTNAMLERIAGEWKDRKIVLSGGPVVLYGLARAALARGMENVLGPGSMVITFGGFKGLSPVGDEEAKIKQFTGVENINYIYGMTELTSAFLMCENRRYHIPPWIIPFAMDPETGRCRERTGAQRGIAGFFDLTAHSHWGGMNSADNVELSFLTCACGRTTPHIGEDIQRVDE